MIKHIIRISISCLLLGYFGFQVDWQVIAEVLGRCDIPWFLISTIVTIASAWLIACKYWLLTRRTSLEIPLTRLLVIHFISRFYALLLPTALGPEAVRWYKVTKNKEGKSFFLAATAYERILFLLTLIGFGMVPLLFYQQHPRILILRDRLIPVAAVCSLTLFSGLLYLFNRSFQSAVKSFFRKILRIRKGNRLDLFFDNLVLKDKTPALLLLLLGITFFWQFFFIARIYGLFNAMNLSLGFIDAAWMGSLVLLLQVLPVSFAGLGVREGAYAYLFTLYGLPAEKGFVIGLLFFTQMLVFSAIGAFLNLFEK